jgi:hypothetical protein
VTPEELFRELEYVLENYDTRSLQVRVNEDLYKIVNWFVLGDGTVTLEVEGP